MFSDSLLIIVSLQKLFNTVFSCKLKYNVLYLRIIKKKTVIKMKKQIMRKISLIMSVIFIFTAFLPCAAAAEVAETEVAETNEVPTESASITDSPQISEKEENKTETGENEKSFFGMVSETVRIIIEWLANFDLKSIERGPLSTISGVINRLFRLFLK